MLQVTIKGMTSRNIFVDVALTQQEFDKVTVLNLKLLFIDQQSLQIETDFLRLLFGGKQLEDEKLLVTYGIQEKSTLLSVVRVLGGGIS